MVISASQFYLNSDLTLERNLIKEGILSCQFFHIKLSINRMSRRGYKRINKRRKEERNIERKKERNIERKINR